MATGSIRATIVFAITALIAGFVCASAAHADIYTWTDKNGSINVSNLTPPAGVDVTHIVYESAPKIASSRDVSDATRQATIQVLDDRVQQLENKLEQARWQPQQAPVQYQYFPVPAPPPVQYVTVNVSTTTGSNGGYNGGYNGCDSDWTQCAGGWTAAPFYYYPASFFVQRPPAFRRPVPNNGGRNFVGHQQPRAPGGHYMH